jgi:hypothetical protein
LTSGNNTENTTSTSTKSRSMPNLKLDDHNGSHRFGNNNDDQHEDNEYDYEQDVVNRPRSVPDFGGDEDNYSSDEEFDLESEYRKVFGSVGGGARRIGFDGSVQHHKPAA